MSEDQLADTISTDEDSRADEASNAPIEVFFADEVSEPLEGKDECKTVSSASSNDKHQNLKEKETATSFRKATMKQPTTEQAPESGIPKRKADNIVPETSVKKGHSLGAIPKTQFAEASAQSGTAQSPDSGIPKRVADKIVPKLSANMRHTLAAVLESLLAEYSLQRGASQSPSKITENKLSGFFQIGFNSRRGSPELISARYLDEVYRRCQGSSDIKPNDPSKNPSVKDAGVIAKSSHFKTPKGLETGQFKRLDNEFTINEEYVQKKRTEETSASPRIRDLCIDFMFFKREHFILQRSMEANMEATYPKLGSMLKQGQGISKIIERISEDVPKDKTALRVENERLNYLITKSAGIFKRIEEQFAVFTKEINEYTSYVTETNKGVEERLQKVLTHVCEVATAGSEVKCA